jgi:hypothetical protein
VNRARPHLNEDRKWTLELSDEELNRQDAFIRTPRGVRGRAAVARPRSFWELSDEEAAAKLPCPPGPVKAYLHRARRLLDGIAAGE